MRLLFLVFTFVCTFFIFGKTYAFADEFKSTPYPVPRFVSLDKSEAYVRTGPGRKFPVKFIFKQKHLPVEVILEYETWRKIRDKDGDAGWVHQSLLSGKRYGIIDSLHEADKAVLYAKPDGKAQKLVLLEQGVIIRLKSCDSTWCNVDAQGFKGWINRKNIWGVYDSEKFD